MLSALFESRSSTSSSLCASPGDANSASMPRGNEHIMHTVAQPVPTPAHQRARSQPVSYSDSNSPIADHSIASVVAHSRHKTLPVQLQHSLVSGGTVITYNSASILQEALSILTCTTPYKATIQVCTNRTTTQADGNYHKLFTVSLQTFVDRHNTAADTTILHRPMR